MKRILFDTVLLVALVVLTAVSMGQEPRNETHLVDHGEINGLDAAVVIPPVKLTKEDKDALVALKDEYVRAVNDNENRLTILALKLDNLRLKVCLKAGLAEDQCGQFNENMDLTKLPRKAK